jgi:hypothetical protein
MVISVTMASMGAGQKKAIENLDKILKYFKKRFGEPIEE